MQNSLLKKYR